MKAALQRLHSPDIPDLETYEPEKPDSFGFLLQVIVSPEGVEGEESFDVEVCTPGWLVERSSKDAILLGRHLLIVFEYDFNNIRNFLAKYVAQCRGESWAEIARQLSRLGRWEFEDYMPW